MNNRSILALAAVVFAVCIGAIWFLQSQPSAVRPAKTEPPKSSPKKVEPPRSTPMEPLPQPPTVAKSVPAPAPAKSTPAPKQLAPWEVKIDQALRAEIGETETAQLLINMIPTLPAEGQAEAAQHVSNLLLDKDYNRVVPLVKNPNMPEEVLDVFMTDLMNREDPVKLPVLLEIAKIPNHPHREEAHSDLEIFLDEDYGTDWAKWDVALKAYLAKEAAEEAAAAASAPAPATLPPRRAPGR